MTAPRTPADQTALNELRWHWDEAYLIEEHGGAWEAERRDTGEVLTALDPVLLRDAIRDDYANRAVQRDKH